MFILFLPCHRVQKKTINILKRAVTNKISDAFAALTKKDRTIFLAEFMLGNEETSVYEKLNDHLKAILWATRI